ncbi:ribosome maturation factor RimP [Candidatus Odyssella thessalonicensis]|uniref:ribosome maturation factor RimP n=1 Tax=Candidatus Odyssella thessalonicensis TaxID=84647 RepID=UPI000225AC13|nr:ribosome maturation factor RimP [Candidatus Odyssella thessalonicensis]
MDILKKVEEILEPSLSHMGYEIVRVQMSGLKRKTLQIMIDRLDGTGIKLEDCEQVSRYASVLLDQHDPISGAYMLEVSSPGLDRPLVKQKDYQRFLGHDIVLKSHVLIGNRKTFHGKLEFASESEVVLTIKNSANESEQVTIPFSDIKSAKLHVAFN